MEYKGFERKLHFKGELTCKGVIRLFREQIKRSEHILDVGAGNGYLIKQINSRFKKIAVGIDLNSKYREVIKGNIINMPFPNNFFDAVICTDVIEHLTDEILDVGLREIYRVLALNGQAIFTTLLDEVVEKNVCKCPKCGYVFHRVRHVQKFTRDELENRMRNAGFYINKVKTTHLGAYSQYHFVTSILKIPQIEYFFPKSIKPLLNKDIILLCSK